MELPEINILVPLYNEELVFDKLISRLKAVMDMSPCAISVILVDDEAKIVLLS